MSRYICFYSISNEQQRANLFGNVSAILEAEIHSCVVNMLSHNYKHEMNGTIPLNFTGNPVFVAFFLWKLVMTLYDSPLCQSWPKKRDLHNKRLRASKYKFQLKEKQTYLLDIFKQQIYWGFNTELYCLH
ncbi:hypothetical protein WA026_005744 [Henosepilachna vigintioctopunctata]|uniref:Uncharacterized protein n=1 Tax=Henosepilachna vigintioctopunctata TaxID=420089 RepID=A0AAW1U2M4_9CUCU